MQALFGLFALALYFLPALNAWGKKHKQTAAIAALNLLAGWTIVGWVIAYTWSATKTP